MTNTTQNTQSPVKTDFDTWFDRFNPIENETGDSGIFVDDKCYMFETYGDDLEKVKAANPECIWTVVEVEDDEDDEESGGYVIVDGFHHVNRQGYIITEKPSDTGCFYEISYD